MDMQLLTKYEPVIGLEIHVQLATETKMFCRCKNDSEATPNSNVCPVCMGYPGTLPVANDKAIELGAKLALALGCTLNEFQRFDRKNYFYPDLPKGYQISQFFYPMGEHGRVAVDYLHQAEKTKQEFEVGITRLHLEEDAGKLMHTEKGTLVDLNRCGTPLAEIVTEPEITSPEHAKAFMQELQRIVRSMGAGNADMEKGQLRVDGNISVRLRGAKEFGNKVEIKNLNSFKFLEKALEYEIGRQIELIEAGEVVVQETRGWDEKTGTTISQRIKEGSIDYRYFPDPDLPPLERSSQAWRGLVGGEIQLPKDLRLSAEKLGLPYGRVSELQDTDKLAEFLEYMEVGGSTIDPVKLSNLLARGLGFADPAQAAEFFAAAEEYNLAPAMIEELHRQMQEPKGAAMRELAEGLQGAGEEVIGEAIAKVLADFAGEVARYQAGEEKLIGFFIGKVIAELGGRVEAAVVKGLVEKALTKEL